MEDDEDESGAFLPPPPAPSFPSQYEDIEEEKEKEEPCENDRASSADYPSTSSHAPCNGASSPSPSPTPPRLTPTPPPFAAPPGGTAPRPKPGKVAVETEAAAPSKEAEPAASASNVEAEDKKRALMKKVAQLTKVVVHLNARNDESEARYEKLRAGFEEEISTITQDAVLKVATYQKQFIEHSDTDKLKEEASKQAEAFATEKAEKISELEVLRSDISARQERMAAQGKVEINRSMSELRNLQTELQTSLEEFRQVLGRSRAELELRDSELRDQRKAELEAVSSGHRHRLDDLRAANAREIASLNSTREQALSHMSRLHDSELTTLKMQALQKRREKAHRLEQDFLEERRSLEQLVSHTSYELEQSRREASDSVGSSATTQQPINAMRAALAEMTKRVEVGEVEASKAREEAALKEAEVAELQAEVTVLQVRQRTAGISNAPAPPHSSLPTIAQQGSNAKADSRNPVAGEDLSEELREAIAGAKQLEAELGQSDIALAHLDEQLTEKEKQVELLEVEIEEEQLRNHQLQARILEREASA